MGRSPCCEKEGLNRGAWTAMEDKILKDYIKANGEGKWRNLPKKAALKRCGKSCRLRWLNYLRPDIKRVNITDDEADLITRLHNLLGNRWSLIVGRLPGRTDNEIKNYWNTKTSKKMNGHLPSCTSNRKRPNPFKRKSNHTTKQSFIPPPSTISCSTVVHTKASRCTRIFITEMQHKTQPLALDDTMASSEKHELVDPFASDRDESSNFTMDFEIDENLISDFLNSKNETLFSLEDIKGKGEIFMDDFDIEAMTSNLLDTEMDSLKNP